MWKQMKFLDMEENWCAGFIKIDEDTGGNLGSGLRLLWRYSSH